MRAYTALRSKQYRRTAPLILISRITILTTVYPETLEVILFGGIERNYLLKTLMD